MHQGILRIWQLPFFLLFRQLEKSRSGVSCRSASLALHFRNELVLFLKFFNFFGVLIENLLSLALLLLLAFLLFFILLILLHLILLGLQLFFLFALLLFLVF